MYEYCKNEDGTHSYGGWFHRVGRIVEEQDSSMNFSTYWCNVNLLEMDGFKYGFTNQMQLAPPIVLGERR